MRRTDIDTQACLSTFAEQLPLPLKGLDEPLRDGFMLLSHDIRPSMRRAFRRHGLAVLRTFRVAAEFHHSAVDRGAIKYAQTRGADLIKDLTDNTREMLKRTVLKALEDRVSATELAQRLRDSGAFEPARALRIARSELQMSHRAGGLAAAKIAGASEKHWRAGECRLCTENDAAGWIPIDDDFPNGGNPHPSCLVGESIVAASGVRWQRKVRFNGELLTVRVRNGHRSLTVTPEHPILTQRGWIIACELRKGDRIVHCVGDSALVIVSQINPHNYYVPATIEEIAGAFLKTKHRASTGMPTAAVRFHSHRAINSEVDVVGSAVKFALNRQAGGYQRAVNQFFCRRHGARLNSFCGSARLTRFGRHLTAAPSFVRTSSVRLPLLRSQPGITNQLDLRGRPWLEPHLEASMTNNIARDAKLVCNLLLRFPSKIEFTDFLNIDSRMVHNEWVFDLETDVRWFIGQGLIVHNCACPVDYRAEPSDESSE